MSELRNAAATRLRPAGTIALITGLVCGAVGTAVLVVGVIAARLAPTGGGMMGDGISPGYALSMAVGALGILAGFVLLAVGAVQRLAGGPGRPVNTGRAAAVGAAIPGGLGILGLVLGLLG